jgi:hypothetical protein
MERRPRRIRARHGPLLFLKLKPAGETPPLNAD